MTKGAHTTACVDLDYVCMLPAHTLAPSGPGRNDVIVEGGREGGGRVVHLYTCPHFGLSCTQQQQQHTNNE